MEATAKTFWAIDPVHSEISFKVKHLMISYVKGKFTDFTAQIEGLDFLNSKITAYIQVGSIDTNNTERDNHLKSADFFDVENHKEIIFESTSLKPKGGDTQYELKGNITIKAITKEIALDLEWGGTNTDPWGNNRLGFSLKGKLNRKDFGVNWNTVLETGGVMIGDEVQISIDAEFIQKTE